MNPAIRAAKVILYSLVFLFFFQLVSDFVETIYAFGLMGTNIPPEIVCVLFFFSPLLLLFFRRGLPRQAGTILVVVAALMRAVEVSAGRSGKMIASGLGTGCLLVLLPVWLAQSGEDVDASAQEMGYGLAGGLCLSILLRTLGAGSDLSLLHPLLSWALAIGLVLLAIWQSRAPAPAVSAAVPQKPSSGASAGLSVGVMGTLALLYFGFSSPTVLARWSGVDYRLVIGLLAATLGLYGAGLAFGWLAKLTKTALWVWNGLFLLSGTAAIWINQVRFPATSGAYPIPQPNLSLAQQIPLLVMILLSPVILLDFTLLTREIKMRQPSPRELAGGFFLGALFFLVIALSQVFTTVYDYIPAIGPWFRDRFWLVFLLAGLGMALPVLAVKNTVKLAGPALRKVYLPVVWVVLLATFVWTLASQPLPAAPANQDTLRLVTYNIQQGYSVDGQRSYLEQLAVLRGLAPDVVGLEESDTARFSGGNADVVRTISQGLGMNVYYGPRTVTGTFGIALLSKYPILDPRTFYMYSTGEQTAAIEARINVNGKPYSILVTHLGNDGPIIQQQQVLASLAGQPAVIAMGDFNFEPSTPQYALTLLTYQDAWVQAGSVITPGLDPARQIDHFFVSPAIKVLSARYVSSTASDHPALMLEIQP